jgi:hypothetical protein
MRHGNIRFCSDMKDSRHDDRRNGRDATQESEEKHRNTTRLQLSLRSIIYRSFSSFRPSARITESSASREL